MRRIEYIRMSTCDRATIVTRQCIRSCNGSDTADAIARARRGARAQENRRNQLLETSTALSERRSARAHAAAARRWSRVRLTVLGADWRDARTRRGLDDGAGARGERTRSRWRRLRIPEPSRVMRRLSHARTLGRDGDETDLWMVR